MNYSYTPEKIKKKIQEHTRRNHKTPQRQPRQETRSSGKASMESNLGSLEAKLGQPQKQEFRRKNIEISNYMETPLTHRVVC